MIPTRVSTTRTHKSSASQSDRGNAISSTIMFPSDRRQSILKTSSRPTGAGPCPFAAATCHGHSSRPKFDSEISFVVAQAFVNHGPRAILSFLTASKNETLNDMVTRAHSPENPGFASSDVICGSRWRTTTAFAVAAPRRHFDSLSCHGNNE